MAKLLAGRDKDLVFAAALIHAGIVDPAVPVIDGAKALTAAVKGVFGAAAAVQRCTLGAAASGRLASRLSRPGAGCHDFFRWPLGPREAGGAG